MIHNTLISIAYFTALGAKDKCSIDNWVKLAGTPGNREYSFEAPAPSWFDSIKLCEACGGWLVEIDSAAEDKAVYGYLKDHASKITFPFFS